MDAISNDLMKEGDALDDTIVKIAKADRTWDNTIKPIAAYESKYSTTENNITFYRYVSTSKELRDKAIAIEEKMDPWAVKSSMRLDVYQAYIEFRDQAMSDG